ncbi:CocE/NonD family hydrolase [Halalkalibacter krulwichiae]|uniref:Cocaine esterase n=1 Tax=Halalkalibacter krulwichiae TaxID=199441 RepID=A0A1X9MEG3_9BACI|nr:CocE/NonD family hydrolase [Halalkalibacter krulwichiae]ARK29931.1 Cocaine esterase [Halalkalibacter krulwichiae]
MKAFRNYKRSSQYVHGYEDIKLAVDIYRPYKDNKMEEVEPLPVILLAGRFHRRKIFLKMQQVIEKLILNGYVYIVLETRGHGASFGYSQGFCEPHDNHDVKEIIEWAATQSWCNGAVAMMGISNMGFIQETTAVTAPAQLVAITPVVCNSDFYYQNYPNGVSAIPKIMSNRPTVTEMGAPVDEDVHPKYPLAKAALKEHENNKAFIGYQFVPNMYRDSANPHFDYVPNMVIPPCEHSETIKETGLSIYQMAGWFDPSVGGQLITYKDWGGQILIGPWNHFQSMYGESELPNGNVDMGEEHLRWFDYILKGIDNGFGSQPPIRYYTQNAPAGEEWRVSDSWPLEYQQNTTLYFGPGSTGTIQSVNDGSLQAQKTSEQDHDKYKVNFDIDVFDSQMGRMDRFCPKNMCEVLDEKGLTYTSIPLQKDTEITGHPVVDLWITSSQTDGNFIAYLEEVDDEGYSRLVTEGFMRASHRKVSKNVAWDLLELPYHRSLQKEAELLPREIPVKCSFHLEAVSYIFKKGSRIRVTITCAERGIQQPEGLNEETEPVIKIFRGGMTNSAINLPIIVPKVNVFRGNVILNCLGYQYSGSSTLYTFRNHVYLRFNNRWMKWETVGLNVLNNIEKYELKGDNGLFQVRVLFTENNQASAKGFGEGIEFESL